MAENEIMLEEAAKIHRLDSTNAEFFTKNSFLALKLKENEEENTIDRVFLHRAFPFELLWKYISVISDDGKEKGVIYEEISMCEDDPSDVCYELNEHVLFGGDNLSREILGSAESVKGITKEKILSYMNNHYVGENIVIGVGGSFDEAEMLEKIKQYF